MSTNATPIYSKAAIRWRHTFFVWFLLPSLAAIAEERPAHHSPDGFANPYVTRASGGFFTVIRSRLFTDEWQNYDPERDVVPTETPDLADTPTSNATVTWIGHATVLIQHQGINVLTDPIFSDRASPLSFVGPKRITQPAVPLEELPEIHAVVISHDHYDHLDTKSIQALGNEPSYFVPLGLKQWFESKGIAADRVFEMDWWDERETNGLRIVATSSQHFSGRSLTNRNKTLWAAWSISWDDFHVWFGGDTGYNELQFNETGTRLHPIDLGIIPIGAYEPRSMMGPIHVNPAEAVLIHKDLEARASMAIHWGAFILSAEGVMTPIEDLDQARKSAEIPESEFAAFAVGETRHYAPRPSRADLND